MRAASPRPTVAALLLVVERNGRLDLAQFDAQLRRLRLAILAEAGFDPAFRAYSGRRPRCRSWHGRSGRYLVDRCEQRSRRVPSSGSALAARRGGAGRAFLAAGACCAGPWRAVLFAGFVARDFAGHLVLQARHLLRPGLCGPASCEPPSWWRRRCWSCAPANGWWRWRPDRSFRGPSAGEVPSCLPAAWPAPGAGSRHGANAGDGAGPSASSSPISSPACPDTEAGQLRAPAGTPRFPRGCSTGAVFRLEDVFDGVAAIPPAPTRPVLSPSTAPVFAASVLHRIPHKGGKRASFVASNSPLAITTRSGISSVR